MPQPQYTMHLKHPRYYSCCANPKCGGRIRVGRKFVIDQIDSKKVYHVGCIPKDK